MTNLTIILFRENKKKRVNKLPRHDEDLRKNIDLTVRLQHLIAHANIVLSFQVTTMDPIGFKIIIGDTVANTPAMHAVRSTHGNRL